MYYGNRKHYKQFLHTGTQIYNTPLLLANALELLERAGGQGCSDTSVDRRIGVGSTVELLDLKDLTRDTFALVLPKDADLKKKRISVLSPLGSSLLGLQQGDICRTTLFRCSYEFRILGTGFEHRAKQLQEDTPS